MDERQEHNLTLEDVAATVEQPAAQLTEAQQETTLLEAKDAVAKLTEAVKGQSLSLVMARRQKQARQEFKDWKKSLMEIVRTGSQLVFRADGSYQFVLPPRLVKLVWSTTIKERVVLERKQRGEEGAEQRAMAAIKEEVAQATAGAMALLDEQEKANAPAPRHEPEPGAGPADGEPGVPA